MKKILFISREFYPMANANTTCLENILVCLSEKYDIDLVTAKRKVLSSKKETRFNINIYRYGLLMENLIYFRNSIIDYISGKKMPTIVLNPLRKILLSSLKPLQPYFEKKGLYYPKAWEKNLVSYIENKIDLGKYDWVFAIGFPYDNVEVAYRLKINNPHLKLAIIELDLFTDNPVLTLKDKNDTYKKRLEKENKWYASTDCLIATKEILSSLEKNENLNIPYSNLEKIEVPVLKEVMNVKPTKKSIILEKESINFVYTGMFYNDIRRPDYLINLFAELFKIEEKIKLHIIGFGCNEMIYKFRKDYPNNVYFYGRKSKEFASNAIISSDFLVNVGNNTTSQAPSKIVEYMGSGKPILNLYNLENDLSVKILTKYPYSISLKENINETNIHAQNLLKFIKKYSDFKDFDHNVLKEFNEYRPQVVVEKIIKKMEEDVEYV